MAFFDKFFVLSKKKLFYLKRSNFALNFIGSIHFTKKFVRSQIFEVGIGSQTHEICLSRLIKQTNVEKF